MRNTFSLRPDENFEWVIGLEEAFEPSLLICSVPVENNYDGGCSGPQLYQLLVSPNISVKLVNAASCHTIARHLFQVGNAVSTETIEKTALVAVMSLQWLSARD